MLTARPGQFRPTDFQTGGQPDLTWYNRYRQYETIVYGNGPGLGELLVPGGVKNGIGQVIVTAANLNPKNEVRDASNWYIDSLTGTPPVIRGGSYADERQNDLIEVVKEMVRITCVVGHGMLTVSNNSIEIISGTNIVPLHEPGNPIPYGWIMFWPYYERPASDRGQLARVTVPNRFKTKFVRNSGTADPTPSEQTQAVYRYSTNVIGEPEAVEPDPEIQLAVPFGVDEGFYEEALKYAGEIARIDAVLRELETTFAIPITVINARVGLTSGTGLVDLQGRPLTSTGQNLLQSTEPTGPAVEFAQAEIMVDKLSAERDEWRERMHGVTRIPLEITERQDMEISGVSRALLSRPAIDRMESIQRSITQALDAALAVISGVTVGSLSIDWARQPFDTLAERRIVAREGYRDGIITLNEAREQIGEQPVPGGDVFNAQYTGIGTEDAGGSPGPERAVRPEPADRGADNGGRSSGNRNSPARSRPTGQ